MHILNTHVLRCSHIMPSFYQNDFLRGSSPKIEQKQAIFDILRLGLFLCLLVMVGARILMPLPAYAQKNGSKVPVSLFGALPEIADAAVSPDGKSVALLENFEDLSIVRFFDLTTGEAGKGLKIGNVKARGVNWVSNEKILLQASQTSRINTVDGFRNYEIWRYAAISKKSGKVQYLLTKGEYSVYTNAGTLMHTLPQDPDKVLIMKRVPNFSKQRNANSRIGNAASGKASDISTLDLHLVNLKNGNARTAHKGNKDTIDWIVDENGEAILRIDYDEARDLKLIKQRKEGASRFETILTVGDEKDYPIYSVLRPGRAIVTAYKGGDKRGVYEYDYIAGKLLDPVFQSDDYDVSSVNVENGRVISFSYVVDRPETQYQVPALGEIVKKLASALKGARLTIVSSSSDNDVSVIRATYVDRPPTYYLFENSFRSLSELGPTYPELNESNSGARQKFDYTTKDGFAINGYLTLPPGIKDPKKLPLVVLPHGGPEIRDNLEFDWWANAYASRGYVVYQPNFRGSAGYGNIFRRAGWGEWGRKMQDDISDGVRKLIADEIVDADRVCIVGASYGGYAALAGATLTPELYQCVISVNGVSDLLVMLGSESRDSEYSLEFWQRRIGSRRDRDELNLVSPRHQAAKVRAPIMLLHGKDDTVVAYGQSQIMNEALKTKGKKVEFITLDGEDHWLSSAATRTKMLESSTKFIDKHIGEP